MTETRNLKNNNLSKTNKKEIELLLREIDLLKLNDKK